MHSDLALACSPSLMDVKPVVPGISLMGSG